MATAKKCDRCGKYYDKNELYKLSEHSRHSVLDGMVFTMRNGEVTESHDLCDECLTLLKEWLKGEINV